MASEPVVVGGTYRWPLTATKDGNELDLTGAAIVLTFLSDNAEEVKRYSFTAATATTYYENPAGTFDVDGTWLFSWKITLTSGQVFETEERSFEVERSLAGLAAA